MRLVCVLVYSRCLPITPRSNKSRRLKAAVLGKLGWAYIAVEGFTRALAAFWDMEKVT